MYIKMLAVTIIAYWLQKFIYVTIELVRNMQRQNSLYIRSGTNVTGRSNDSKCMKMFCLYPVHLFCWIVRRILLWRQNTEALKFSLDRRKLVRLKTQNFVEKVLKVNIFAQKI